MPGVTMEIIEEVERHLAVLSDVQGFLEKAELKRRTLRQGDYTFARIH